MTPIEMLLPQRSANYGNNSPRPTVPVFQVNILDWCMIFDVESTFS